VKDGFYGHIQQLLNYIVTRFIRVKESLDRYNKLTNTLGHG
jgi:hypothetical protein